MQDEIELQNIESTLIQISPLFNIFYTEDENSKILFEFKENKNELTVMAETKESLSKEAIQKVDPFYELQSIQRRESLVLPPLIFDRTSACGCLKIKKDLKQIWFCVLKSKEVVPMMKLDMMPLGTKDDEKYFTDFSKFFICQSSNIIDNT